MIKNNLFDIVNKKEYEGLKYNKDFTICYGPKNSSLEYATLHPNTKIIEEKAFSNTKIKGITCNEGLEKISNLAFNRCYRLKEINFPSTLKTIGFAAFANAGIEVADFSACNELTFKEEVFFESNLASIILPPNLEEIPTACFAYCSRLVEVNLPDSLIEIGIASFNHCRHLNSIDLKNVKYLDDSCFACCANLKIVKCNSGFLKIIDRGAFEYCGLEQIDLSKCSIKTLHENTFNYTNLKEAFLSDTLETIYGHCFLKTNLTTITLPNSMKKIDKDFVSNKSSEEITIRYNELPKNVIGTLMCSNYNLVKQEKTLDELIHSGKSFKEMNKILKERESER